MQKKTVWSRNFTIITLGTLISAIGGAGITLGLTLVVFDQTQSTWLSGVYAVVSRLPGLTLPVLLSPLIDRMNRKHMVVVLDVLNGLAYLGFMVFILQRGFEYGAYLLFGLLTSSIGMIYSLAYSSLYPDMIPEGMEQKGYAVSSMIYPIASIAVTPVAALMYEKWNIEILFFIVGTALLIAAAFESRIDYVHVHRSRPKQNRLRQYADDLLEGFRYLKQETGVRSIFAYRMVAGAVTGANQNMAVAFFQTSGTLTTPMYALLSSAEAAGRFIGSMVHYVLRIPPEKRYALCVNMYAVYDLCDGVMLFMAYPVMIVIRFLCGFLGTQTKASQYAAVQRYLPSDMRARVNGLFSVLCVLSSMVVQLIIGALGEVLPYQWVTALFAGISLTTIFFMLIRNKRHVERIYNTYV